jgi:hypothetical protein
LFLTIELRKLVSEEYLHPVFILKPNSHHSHPSLVLLVYFLPGFIKINLMQASYTNLCWTLGMLTFSGIRYQLHLPLIILTTTFTLHSTWYYSYLTPTVCYTFPPPNPHHLDVQLFTLPKNVSPPHSPPTPPIIFHITSFFYSPSPCPSLWRNRIEADCGSEGMAIGFDPHSGQSKVRLFSLSILTDKIVLAVQSCTPPSTGSLVSV